MQYSVLLDLATDVGYELAMCGAETFRVEESISRILAAYGIDSEVFAIPNYLIVSTLDPDGSPVTRMRRIGPHGNDLDGVERFSNLSRRLCACTPPTGEAVRWLEEACRGKRTYSLPIRYLGIFLGAAGFALFFQGSWMDALCAGLCGLLVGLTTQVLDKMKANTFFSTLAAAFAMGLLAYALGAAGLSPNPDAATIGALMLLVPGLLFTNAMRDIIYGDTNSGINRIVQVLLIAVAIALGTAGAWSIASSLWGSPVSAPDIPWSIPAQCLFSLISCIGFSIVFNIHGPGGILCALGGVLSWAVYALCLSSGSSDIIAYFWAGLASSVYSEAMARIRKYPAISYLVVSIFPLIPGAGVYYTMNHAVRGNMAAFYTQSMHTAAIAGILAVGILLGSTVFRMYGGWQLRRIMGKERK